MCAWREGSCPLLRTPGGRAPGTFRFSARLRVRSRCVSFNGGCPLGGPFHRRLRVTLLLLPWLLLPSGLRPVFLRGPSSPLVRLLGPGAHRVLGSRFYPPPRGIRPRAPSPPLPGLLGCPATDSGFPRPPPSPPPRRGPPGGAHGRLQPCACGLPLRLRNLPDSEVAGGVAAADPDECALDIRLGRFGRGAAALPAHLVAGISQLPLERGQGQPPVRVDGSEQHLRHFEHRARVPPRRRAARFLRGLLGFGLSAWGFAAGLRRLGHGQLPAPPDGWMWASPATDARRLGPRHKGGLAGVLRPGGRAAGARPWSAFPPSHSPYQTPSF